MSDPDTTRRLAAVRSYLRRTCTRAQLVTINDAYFAASIGASTPEKLATILTSTNFGASGGSAALTGLQPLDVVELCEALIKELDRAEVTSWTTAQSAQDQGESARLAVSWATAVMQ